MMIDDQLKDLATDVARSTAASALFLAGSRARGKADRFSDIDFVAVAEQSEFGQIALCWQALLEDRFGLVFWNERGGRTCLLNAITERWVRFDLLIIPLDGLQGRARSTLKPLFDRTDIYASLPSDLPLARPDPQRILSIIREFIRVLGLTPVGVGRHEYVTLVKGVSLLRDLLIDLMLEDCPDSDRGGALHLSRLLRPEQLAVLENLPYPGPHRDALINAFAAIARVFLPIARDMADRLVVPWPEAFDAATRRHLMDELGMEI